MEIEGSGYIVEAEVCSDHVHMHLKIPAKVAVSSFMGYLKGKSCLMIYEQFPELKFKYRKREFWCCGYYAGEQLTMSNSANLRAASDRTTHVSGR